MKRRNFLATLLAPILARFAWKNNPDPRWPLECKYAGAPGTGWLQVGVDLAESESLTITDWYVKGGAHYQQVGNGPIERVEDWPATLYFSKPHNPNEWPWETKA